MPRSPRFRLGVPTTRLPRVRFRVRWLVVALAFLAVGVGGWKVYARQRLIAESTQGFRKKSIWYSSMAKNFTLEATFCDQMVLEKQKNPDLHPTWDVDRLISVGSRHRQMASYYQGLSARYDEAAHSPLDPVPPDPPMP